MFYLITCFIIILVLYLNENFIVENFFIVYFIFYTYLKFRFIVLGHFQCCKKKYMKKNKYNFKKHNVKTTRLNLCCPLVSFAFCQTLVNVWLIRTFSPLHRKVHNGMSSHILY